MTDLENANDQFKANTENVYFQNKRIRRFLILSGLINRKGEILPAVNHERLRSPQSKPNKKQLSKEKPSKMVRSYVLTNENKRQTNGHNQLEITVTCAKTQKNSDSKLAPRGSSKVHHSPSLKKKKGSPARTESTRRLSRRSKTSLTISSAPASCSARHHVTMIYYGSQTLPDYDTSWCHSDGDEILVSQQHCGGENLIVFKGHVKAYGKFSFESRRHPDYPFALTLYVNGLINTRISTCCEYRHKRNIPLGGKQGLFGIVDIADAKPCPSCRLTKAKRKKQSNPSIGLVNPPDYRSSFSPNFLTKSRTTSPVIHKNSSPIASFSTRKNLSPNISRTPTPSSERYNSSNINSAEHDRRRSSISLHSNDQNIEVSHNDNNQAYSSDFDENNDTDLPETNSRFDQPRISNSHSAKSQDSSGNSSEFSEELNHLKNKNKNFKSTASYSTSSSEKSYNIQHESNDEQAKPILKKSNNYDAARNSSPSTPIQSNRSKEENNFFLSEASIEKTNTINQPQKSSTTTTTTITKKLLLTQNENEYNKSKPFTNRNNDDDNSSFPFSMPQKKSGPVTNEDDFFLVTAPAPIFNPVTYSRKSSSDSSSKSDLSPKYSTKQEMNTKHNNTTTTTTATNNNNNRHSLVDSFEKTIEGRNIMSNSNEIMSRTSITKKTQETYLSSNVRRISTSSSDDMFSNKHTSSSKKEREKHASELNDDWFKTVNTTDSGNKTTTVKFNMHSKSTS